MKRVLYVRDEMDMMMIMMMLEEGAWGWWLGDCFAGEV